nr:hypothetical protein [uncultured Flavobacterium sp.]
MKPLLFSLLAVTLTSCQKEKEHTPPTSITENSVNITEPDSIVLEKYWKWIEAKTNESFSIKPTDTLALKRLEVNRNEELLDNFLTASDSLKSRLYDDYTPEKLKRHLYTFDFNGDSFEDVIYYGPSGGEGNTVHFFLNKQNGFKNLFTQSQTLQKPVVENGKLTGFTILNPGCCAEYEIVEYNYAVDYNKATPTFMLKNTIGYLDDYQKPEKMLSKEMPFTIKTAKASLRPECYILNIEHPIYGEAGNEIVAYDKGHKGKAIGTRKEDGKDWLYVQMEPTKTKKGYTDVFHTQPTAVYGWIIKSDTDLK